MTFAKLFETEKGQIVVLLQTNEDNDPEIRFFVKPENMGVCSTAFGYEEDDFEGAQEGFDKVTFEMAAKAQEEIFALTKDL